MTIKGPTTQDGWLQGAQALEHAERNGLMLAKTKGGKVSYTAQQAKEQGGSDWWVNAGDEPKGAPGSHPVFGAGAGAPNALTNPQAQPPQPTGNTKERKTGSEREGERK